MPTTTATPDFELRSATPADLDTLVEFNQAMARETESRELNNATLSAGVGRVLNDPSKGRYLVVTHNDTVIGQLMLTLEWSDWRNGDFWWIQSVYVAPEFRRHGVFRLLFEHVHHEATDTPGVCGIRLYVEEENQRAITTYLDLGALRTDYAMMEWDFGRTT